MGGTKAGVRKPAKGSGTIQALDRGLMVLEALAASAGDASLSQLAAQFPWHKSTTLRLLNTLVQHGQAERDPESSRYRLGLGILRLSSALGRRLDLRERAREPVRKLADRARETAHLAILDRGEAVVLEQAETAERIRIITYIGMRMPCHCTALGKALLAFLPKEELDRQCDSRALERYTDRTIVDPKELRLHLAEVREQGYAFDDEESYAGMSCLAAPVRDRDGRVVAAVGISGPSGRMHSPKYEGAVRAVMEAAGQVSERGGGGGPPRTPAPAGRRAGGPGAG
ncbi:MAG: IclR family transcriptional regulator, partial [Gemmatimonadota bacterium]